MDLVQRYSEKEKRILLAIERVERKQQQLATELEGHYQRLKELKEKTLLDAMRLNKVSLQDILKQLSQKRENVETEVREENEASV